MKDIWFVILNPMAGRGLAHKRWRDIEAALQKLGIAYTVKFSEHRGHAIRLADDAILNGYRKILGIGGDGTNHEICNGILQQKWVPSTDVLYALLPVGTGNDWARQWHITKNIEQRLQNLLQPKIALQDVGLVTYQHDGSQQSRYFVNVAGMAYDAFIAQRLGNKPLGSQLQYLWMVARCLFSYKLLPATLDFNEQKISSVFYTINVGICKYSGGGMQLVPHAIPNDGWLALTMAHQLPKWEVLLQTPRFYNGTLLQHPKLEGHQVKTLHVNHPDHTNPTLLEADGEFLGETPCSFSILENALRVCL